MKKNCSYSRNENTGKKSEQEQQKRALEQQLQNQESTEEPE